MLEALLALNCLLTIGALIVLRQIKETVMTTESDIQALSDKFDTYVQLVTDYIAQIKRNVQDEIDAAVKADDAAEQPGIATLGGKITAAIDAVPKPTPPEPSNL